MSQLTPIEVRRYGAGDRTVVVLHGGPGAPGSASGLGQALAKDFRILEPLQRRSGIVPLTVGQHVADLAVVAPSPAILIGWSWGAMLALSFAARFPERASALVLVGCGTYSLETRALFQGALERRLGEQARAKIHALKARLSAASDPAARDAALAELGAAYMAAESYDLLPDLEPVSEALLPDQAGHAQTWGDVLRLQALGSEPASFSAISARTLLIHGDVDPHPGAATRDLLRPFIPGLQYVELDRCGHEPWRERHARDRFVALVREWLDSGP